MARTLFYAVRGTRARAQARVRRRTSGHHLAPIFIIGCGRSGTTVLGEMFALHPSAIYLYEPYHLWAAIEPTTDFVSLYSRSGGHCLLDASAVTPAAQKRFQRLMAAPHGRQLVEKSPINALRLGFLTALAPEARFVHIVRDGVDVADSIARIATVTRKMAFRPPLNEWWGVGDAKWIALEADGRAAGYYADEVRQLHTDRQRGAYEWLVSLREVGAWRRVLGDRCVELRYKDVAADPTTSLRRLADSLGLSCPSTWLARAASLVRSGAAHPAARIVLPSQMRTDFNRLQATLGFTGRAIP